MVGPVGHKTTTSESLLLLCLIAILFLSQLTFPFHIQPMLFHTSSIQMWMYVYCREEGTRAIHEAVRLALHENNTKQLQHCLVCLFENMEYYYSCMLECCMNARALLSMQGMRSVPRVCPLVLFILHMTLHYIVCLASRMYKPKCLLQWRLRTPPTRPGSTNCSHSQVKTLSRFWRDWHPVQRSSNNQSVVSVQL